MFSKISPLIYKINSLYKALPSTKKNEQVGIVAFFSYEDEPTWHMLILLLTNINKKMTKCEQEGLKKRIDIG